MSFLNRDFKRDFRLLTSPLRVKPGFIIPGEAKCGTTSLYIYMVDHPDIFPADRKEPNNFIQYPQSMVYLKSHYPPFHRKVFREKILSRKFVTGEASAEYLSKPRVPRHVAALLPSVKLIVLLRNPVTRAYSDYQMLKGRGVINGPFESVARRNIEWLSDPGLAPLVEAAAEAEHNPARYLRKGLYAESIARWLECFPRESFLFLKSESFFENPQRTLDRVFDFLGLPGHRPREFRVGRRGDYDVPIDPRLAEEMAEFFRPHNERLYELIGEDLGWERELRESLAPEG
ncbi:MAG: sulfotransferase domain-containing protein [Candidatus Nitrospinota bacterium M3_3B_026]